MVICGLNGLDHYQDSFWLDVVDGFMCIIGAIVRGDSEQLYNKLKKSIIFVDILCNLMTNIKFRLLI